MTAVDRLTAIIAGHRVGYDLVDEALCCDCGERWTLGSMEALRAAEDAHIRHVAAVIAAADDLAVVELQKPNEREDDDTATTWGESYSDLRVGVHDEYADQVQVWVDYEPIEPWSPGEAEDFASHLMAAASTARAYQAAHGMLPGSHERPCGPECRCGKPWDRWNDRCSSAVKAAEGVSDR